jgi:hypothetical protein
MIFYNDVSVIEHDVALAASPEGHLDINVNDFSFAEKILIELSFPKRLKLRHAINSKGKNPQKIGETGKSRILKFTQSRRRFFGAG